MPIKTQDQFEESILKDWIKELESDDSTSIGARHTTKALFCAAILSGVAAFVLSDPSPAKIDWAIILAFFGGSTFALGGAISRSSASLKVIYPHINIDGMRQRLRELQDQPGRKT